ncbi:glycosyltransferase [Chryseobacterium sp. H3056]|uniref:Glycosyltransferase n=1 Tax=Kaistella daneshvariae TaxID=2487074 RepID=A0A3N0WVW5_9FLAO|nr:glycosyltransferase [Kaistella daneshvariae]ROI09226.1 glycosyltransferase [Kaistella daneshvariae]
MVPKISVIVPVYNADAYLRPCIESLIGQSFKDIELIFVNDGSSDDSLRILQDFAARDHRIRIIDQPNQGVSAARNRGLQVATAEYISFVDADDWLPLLIYEKVAAVMDATSVDIILYNMETTLGGYDAITSYPFPPCVVLGADFIQQTVYRRLISEDDLFSPCNKLYRSSIIASVREPFPVDNDLSEDNIFNLKYFGQAKSMYYLDEVGYHYREVEGSATRSLLGKDYLKNYLEIYHLNYRDYFDISLPEEDIQLLKTKKLLQNIRSMVFFYFSGKGGPSRKQRFSLVRKMLSNPEVDMIIKRFPKLLPAGGKYNQLLNWGIKTKNTILLYMLAKYSEIRAR